MIEKKPGQFRPSLHFSFYHTESQSVTEFFYLIIVPMLCIINILCAILCVTLCLCVRKTCLSVRGLNLRLCARILPFYSFTFLPFQNGPQPMHEVVPSAVSAAVSAAIAMRITTSQILFFFIRF
jgi:hypothetical protein